MIQLIEIFTERDLTETLNILDFQLKKLGLILNQKVMFYTVNNKAYYVTVKPKPQDTKIDLQNNTENFNQSR